MIPIASTPSPAAPPLRIAQLRQRLADLGGKPAHIERVLRGWSQCIGYDTPTTRAENFLPLRLRQELPAIEAELAALARLRSEHAANPETARLLIELVDGQLAESVLLPRGGLCISTQIGCAVGCTFCMSGRGGLVRQLGSSEMVAQVVLARRQRAVRKVVFMGMGEPAHNLENVLEALDLLGREGGLAHKQLVLSTVGDRRLFERLPQQRVKPALALSLHSAMDDQRAELLPRAPRIPVAELVAMAEHYARASHHPVQYQWTLIEGVNDSEQEMARLADLLAGKYGVLNFIPFNEVEGLAYRRPSAARIAELCQLLHRRGIHVLVRDSAGQEIEGACGQLRVRAEQRQTWR